jgi:GNAT superfamily N-acetyltransferase
MFEVQLLIDRPDIIDTLAGAYEREWPGWYGRAGNAALADLTARCRRNGLPLGLVAIAADKPVGACALVTTAGPIETDELPWLGALWVDPAQRRRGIATLLIERASVEAARQGYARLQATTHGAAPLFHALGWRLREMRELKDGPLAIFDRPTASV